MSMPRLGRDIGPEPIDDHPEVVRAFATKYGGWDAADASAYGPRILIRVAPGA